MEARRGEKGGERAATEPEANRMVTGLGFKALGFRVQGSGFIEETGGKRGGLCKSRALDRGEEVSALTLRADPGVPGHT